MNALKATPGPWMASGKGWEVRACDEQMKVCDIRGWGYLTGKCARALPDEEAIAIQCANECLIAASPDLYEALADIDEWLLAGGDLKRGDPLQKRAHKAVVRARGEEQS